jgi:predicted nucleic acid-binding protein
VGILIDTCIWIDVEQGRLAPADIATITGDAPVYLSPVTIAELRFGAEIASDPAIRQKRLAALGRLRKKPLLPIDAATADIFGSVAAAIKSAGRSHRYRVQDIWLASQAIQYGFAFLTRNQADFDDIPGLVLQTIPSTTKPLKG